jgi:nucleoside-diphosphate-sugar epimerase
MSKAAMEKVALGFHQGLGLKVSTLRLLNNYGPRQSARAVIPCIISQALVRNDVHLGALEPKMDFNYISDTLDAFLKTAENVDVQGKVLTWGTGTSISIGELAQLVFSLIGREGLHIVTDKERIRPYPGPMPSLEEDILATHRLINYFPKISIQEGLKKTIEWISEHIDQYKTDTYVI